ncbi:MAG TPA: DMT family transporter [Actinoplanes sp.]|nr:DMT family transporter [Actinoplanes sp.]
MLLRMGPLLCLLSAASFGAMAVFGKYAFAAGVTPSTLLLIRFSLAAVILALLTGRPGRISGKAVAVAFGLGALGYAAQASLYFEALRIMDASLLALVFYTYPLLVTVLAVLAGRDRLTRARAAALTTATGGILLVLLGSGGAPMPPLGVALALASALTYTCYILVADRIVQRIPPLQMATVVMAGAAVAMAGRSALTGGPDLNFGPAGWFWLGCVVVVSTILAMLTFLGGLRRTGPSTAAILSIFEPLVTAVLATMLLGEALTPLQVTGGLLVLVSALILQLPGRLLPSVRARVASVRPRSS